jgi:hypothetical protein
MAGRNLFAEEGISPDEGRNLFAEEGISADEGRNLLADEKPKLSISDIMRGRGLSAQSGEESLKAAGRGLAKLVTTGGGLGELGLPFLSEKEFGQYIEPYVGKTPKEYQPIETITELGGALLPLPKVGKLAAPTYLRETLKKAEEILTGARELGEQLTGTARQKAEDIAAQTEKDRLTRQIAIRKEMARPEKVSPELDQIHTAARSETKFAVPDTIQSRVEAKDLTSDIGRVATEKLQAAEKRLAGGGDKFGQYIQYGTQLDASRPLALSPAGEELKASLIAMSKNRNLTREQNNLAADTLAKLFPEKGDPRGFKTFDIEYRRLSDKAAGKSDVKIGPVERDELKSVADQIETALENFVGKENYARPFYAEEAKDINKFRQDLGEALASRTKGEYELGKGEVVTARTPEKILFADRQSVKTARQLLGNEQVNAFAERHAANEIQGKTGQQIKDWLNSSKAAFAYEVPGLWEKINAFGENVARREGDAKAMEALRKQMEDHLKTVGTVADQAQGKAREAIKVINTQAQKLAKQSPEKLTETWLGAGGAPGMRATLEDLGMFEKADLDRLESQLLEAGKMAEKEAASAASRKAIMDFVKIAAKKSGLPVGIGGAAYGAYEAGKSLLGND